MNQLVFRTVLGQVSKCQSGWYIEPVDRNMESFDLGPCTAFTKSRTAASESLQPDRCESAKTGQQRFRRLHSRDHVIRVWMRTAVRKEVTSFGTSARFATNSATVWIFSDSDLPTHGILAASTIEHPTGIKEHSVRRLAPRAS